MLSIRRKMCAQIVALSLIAMTNTAISASPPNASLQVRSVDGNSADLVPYVLTSIRLTGDAMFEHPVIISVHKQKSGDVFVSFQRPTSQRMVTPGRKPVAGLMQILFTSKHIELRPANIPLQISKDYSVPPLSEVAEFACSSLLKKCRDGDEFELDINPEISKEQGAYYVLLTPVPFTPDHYASVTVHSKSGKLEISRDDPRTQ